MSDKFPTMTKPRPSVPMAFEGQVFEQVGKYARQAVLYAFQEVGGPEALTVWAAANPDDFYTKLFPKIIAKESEVKHTRDIDEIMDVIDADYEIEDADVITDTPPPTPELAISETFYASDLDALEQWGVDELVEFEL